MKGKDLSPRPLGDDPLRSPSPSFRSGIGNTSCLISTVINPESVARDVAAERSCRMQADPDFVKLCSASQEASAWTNQIAKVVKSRVGDGTSKTTLAASLEWPE